VKIGDIIMQYIHENGINQSDFAKKSDLTKGYISMLINGINPQTKKPFTRLSGDTIVKLSKAMNMTVNELLEQMDNMKVSPEPNIPNMTTIAYTPARAMVPIIGAVRCGPGGLAFEDLQGAEIADVPNPAEYFYLRADGDSMEPKISAGDLVLIHKQEEVENGELAVVIINGEEGTLKRFMRKDGAVILQSFNPEYPPRIILGEELKSVCIAGKAVELKRKL